ncbi:hypothetical protein LguiA_020365 [Lonicera macranthoides]
MKFHRARDLDSSIPTLVRAETKSNQRDLKGKIRFHTRILHKIFVWSIHNVKRF